MNLQNKVIVLTGASKGLGREMALLMAKAGAKLVLSSRAHEHLKLVAQETGGFALLADVSNEHDVMRLAETAVEHFGRIDVWINNAGIWIPHAEIEVLDTAKVLQMMQVNVMGTIYGSKAAYIQMKRQGGSGTIVNILSTSALAGRPFSAGYCASKWAVRGFTESLQAEAKGTGIDVVAVYPGGMQTHFFDEQKPADYDTYMNPAEVAGKIVQHLEAKELGLELILRRG